MSAGIESLFQCLLFVGHIISTVMATSTTAQCKPIEIKSLLEKSSVCPNHFDQVYKIWCNRDGAGNNAGSGSGGGDQAECQICSSGGIDSELTSKLGKALNENAMCLNVRNVDEARMYQTLLELLKNINVDSDDSKSGNDKHYEEKGSSSQEDSKSQRTSFPANPPEKFFGGLVLALLLFAVDE
ncbi:hypothetical protein H4219_006018 [Mycoemilia scoparia]|uniref:Uncharacterized protein n=1 Tax=Mycoemilia scoparia TaxID=417184 RepID=A0A9W8DNU2_9FUNG|nr:hypothetical protein H4219_006018 [Mycoemilia scoparia]